MDKRIAMLKMLSESHQKLLDRYHSGQKGNVELLEFCRLFISFIEALNPHFSPKRFDHIFQPSPDLFNKAVLNSHLHSAAEYATTIIARIENDSELDLSNELVGVVFDFAALLLSVQQVYNIPFSSFAGSRNMQLSSYSSYKVAVQIFWAPRALERSNTLNGYAIFALRQAIELAGKELIGLANILDADQTVFRYGMQIPWDFIALHHKEPYFSLAFDPIEIQKIFRWSNHFVHTGRNAFCHVLASALKTVEQLYQINHFTNLYGVEDSCYKNEILDYNSLKSVFEEHLALMKKPKLAKWAIGGPKLSVIRG